MTSLTSMLIFGSLLVGLISLGTTGNAAFAQAPYFQAQNVENGSPPTVEELREKLQPAKNVILIKKDGQIVLNGTPLSVEELRDQLRRAKLEDPSFRAAVHGDADLSYLDVARILDIV